MGTGPSQVGGSQLRVELAPAPAPLAGDPEGTSGSAAPEAQRPWAAELVMLGLEGARLAICVQTEKLRCRKGE